MPDQWRGMDLGAQPGAQVRTPNLDRLAASGIQFDSAVANAPVCTPARACLLTGKYPHQVDMAVNDLPIDSGHNTIAKILAREGYFTGLIGKWHLQGGPRMPGFVPPGERRMGFEFWAANICNHSYLKQTYFRDDPTPIPMPGYEVPYWTDLALAFLDRAETARRPYFLCVHYGPPHDPYLFPPGFESRYDPAAITLRPNWKPGARLGSREHIAAYYAAIEHLDEQMGRLLRRAGSNTVVVFLSDHGDMLGSQGTSLKRKPWEESARIPLIFSWPGGLKGGWRTDTPISHIDLVPTLLGLAGLTPPSDMPGHNFAPFLRTRRGKTLTHSMLMSHSKTEDRQFDPWRGLRTPRYKYARFRDRPWVLYDMAADPYELHNLATSPSHAKLRAGFDRDIDAWIAATNDRWDEQVDVLLRGRP
jgi:arylsulfatase A-like enzyme